MPRGWQPANLSLKATLKVAPRSPGCHRKASRAFPFKLHFAAFSFEANRYPSPEMMAAQQRRRSTNETDTTIQTTGVTAPILLLSLNAKEPKSVPFPVSTSPQEILAPTGNRCMQDYLHRHRPTFKGLVGASNPAYHAGNNLTTDNASCRLPNPARGAFAAPSA
ncbi:hypothetical protein CKAH01_08816 [Colletotrichum kahawae]|uniref:Uncharacterized protein n=1 Tax=Colletotrichum kahawae TaxID=34407 RepID=A0AAD9Y1A3_COLKA|nr:hypothetical protein CKAH01_08816 [Colletotrichum kahawae]